MQCGYVCEPRLLLCMTGRGEESKDGDAAVHKDLHEPVQLEPLTPMTVELSVELEKWESASDALRLVPQHHSS